ncbi:unnamed protein product [Camellia sinensis]
MASGSSGRNNSASKGFDFATTDDIVSSYEDYDNEDNYNGKHSDSVIGSNSAKAFEERCSGPENNAMTIDIETRSYQGENEQLSKYGDTKTTRSIMLIELKVLIEANPLFREKLVFPTLKSSRLRTLINQRYYYRIHQLCKNPRPNPDIKTLFTDHTCTPPNGALAPTSVSLPPVGVAKPTAYLSLGAHGPFLPAAATANANALASWMVNATASSSVQAAVVTASSLPVPASQVNIVDAMLVDCLVCSILKRPITPLATLVMVDYQSTDHEQLRNVCGQHNPLKRYKLEAGCFSVILKCVLALGGGVGGAAITSVLQILTIGIGAGTFCSGQVN